MKASWIIIRIVTIHITIAIAIAVNRDEWIGVIIVIAGHLKQADRLL